MQRWKRIGAVNDLIAKIKGNVGMEDLLCQSDQFSLWTGGRWSLKIKSTSLKDEVVGCR